MPLTNENQTRPVYRVAQGGDGKPEIAHGTGVPESRAGHAEAEAVNPLAENPALYYSAMGAIAALVVIIFGVLTTRNLTLRNPSRRQSLVEQGVDSMNWFCRNAIGPGGEKFTPLIGTVFAFVLVSNLFGALPFVFKKTAEGVASFTPAPTANLSMTIAISLVVFIVVQYVGIKENGVGGYFKHFAGPVPAISPLLFPLELFGAIVKPVSLSIRLFGNIFGEETVIAVLVGLGAAFFLPVHLPMVVFGVFGSLIQAGVYTILTCAYISLSIGEHGDHGEHHLEDEFGADIPDGHAPHTEFAPQTSGAH